MLDPIDQGDEQILELRLKKPKAKHLKKMKLDQPTMEDMLILAGKLAAEPPSVIDELGVEDLFEVIEVIGDFLGLMEGKVGKIA